MAPILAGYRGVVGLIFFSYAEKRKRRKRDMDTTEIGKMESRGKLSPETPSSPPAEPIFRSAHSALKFAMNFSHGTLKQGFLAAAAGANRPGRGLAGLDGAAQSGMILAELRQLHTLWRSMLIARFTPRTTPCACKALCCSSQRPNPDWTEAIGYLSEYVLIVGLTGTISHSRLRRALVGRFFGVKESFITISQTCGLDRHTASEYNKAVVEHFRDQEALAMDVITDRLLAAGIVDSVVGS